MANTQFTLFQALINDVKSIFTKLSEKVSLSDTQTITGLKEFSKSPTVNSIPLELPTGTIISFAGTTIPDGFLICNGSEISRENYSKLFSVIGTTYGSGDGNLTFKIPDLRDRVLEGSGSSSVGTYLSAGLPNITGEVYLNNPGPYYSVYVQSVNGSFTQINLQAKIINATSGADTELYHGFSFNASKSNSIYGNSNTVQMPSLNVNYLIKF